MSIIEKGASTTTSSITGRLSTGYGKAEARVEEMIAYRTAFTRIEEFIEGVSDLTEKERAALWMFAWARGNGWRRRRQIMFGDYC